MRSELNPDKKTWDGLRGLFALIALIFIGIFCWLIFHEKMLEHEARILLTVPISAFTISIALSFFASDDLLRKVFKWLLIFNLFMVTLGLLKQLFFS